MRTIKYTPSVCKGDAPTWGGHIELRVPSFFERCEFAQKLGVQFDESGALDKAKLNQLALMKTMVEASKEFYVAVHLVKLSGGEAILKFDDMLYEEDLFAVLGEIAMLYINGFNVGNG